MSITDKPKLETKQLGAVASSQARDEDENRYKQKTGNELLATAERLVLPPTGQSIWGCSQHIVSCFTKLASTHKHLQACSKKGKGQEKEKQGR